jgi:hypothetical protein
MATSHGTGGNIDFTLGTNQQHGTSGAWNTYETFLADVNGDGRADMVWSRGPSTGGHVRIYLGITGSTGRTLSFPGPFDRTSYGIGANVFPHVGDVNGDGKADVVIAWGKRPVPEAERRTRCSSPSGRRPSHSVTH